MHQQSRVVGACMCFHVGLPISRRMNSCLQGTFAPLRGLHLAREFGMSPSGFHGHFKAVTAMSPLQFQKQLRLQAARRLLLGEDLDAATAGYRFDYEDASQFSKEFKRLFGKPVLRKVERLRQTARMASAA